MKRSVLLINLVMAFIVVNAHAAYDSAKVQSNAPLRIVRITPSGNDVPVSRQIVIQFNRPVVPLGRMERNADEIPISIEPSLNGQWRWLNTTALACQLDQKNTMAPATQYTLTIRPGIMAEDGGTIDQTVTHTFITQRPQVRYAWFATWRSPGTPVIRVTFNQSVTLPSVQDHLYMVWRKRSNSRYPVKVEPDPRDHSRPRFIIFGEKKYVLDLGKNHPQKSDDELRRLGGVEARRIWLVSPETELPLNAAISLRIEPGLVSALGQEKSVINREIVRFDTFPDFAFIGVRCYDNQTDQQITILPNDSHASNKQCNPLEYVELLFTAPVLHSQVKDHVIFDPDLAGGRTDYDPWENYGNYSRLSQPHKKGRLYSVGLPELLKAHRQYAVKSKDDELTDEFGRRLPESIDIQFFTDHRKPDFRLLNQTGVLEKNVDSEIPLAVTNMQQVSCTFDRLTPGRRDHAVTVSKNIPQVEDVAFLVPLGVREMLDNSSGAVYGRVDTVPAVDKDISERIFFAQITPFQIHAKVGHFNTLVWVSNLADGKPVKDALVRVYIDAISSLSKVNKVLALEKTDENGIAILPGSEHLDPELKTFSWWDEDGTERIFINVVKEQDMALLPLAPRFEIDTWRVSRSDVSPYYRKKYGHIRTWGTTAQGVYRAGDTVQYKFYVRNQNNLSFSAAPRRNYTLNIIDPKGKIVHTVEDIVLSEFGACEGEYTVPKTGAVGWYRFELKADFAKLSWVPLRVLISDFTPSPFKVKSDLNGDLFQPGDTVQVSTRAMLHAGGPYVDAPARITATLSSRWFTSDHHAAKDFEFDTMNNNNGRMTIFQKSDALNDSGELNTRFELKDQNIYYGRMVIESAVKDDRGKFIASSAGADYVGRDRFVGLKRTRWIYQEDEPADIKYIVVNEKGTPVDGTAIALVIERRETKASRVKGAGNAYVTQFVDEWVKIAEIDTVSSQQSERMDFVPVKPGLYRVSATISDTRGRQHRTEINAYVAGKGRILWPEPDDNSLDIVPEQKTYQVGDTARYMIKNPFPGAVALITIDRYGVIDHWVRPLEGNTPLVEFPIKPDYMPGFYLNVTVVSERVEAPLKIGEPDLGKPSFRTGYLSVPVKDPYKEIKIEVTPEKQKYRPGDTVNVDLQATVRHADKAEPIEMAVAVLDEAVFDLLQQGRNYFDPYNGFYSLEGLDLRNYSLLKMLVGRQKFEKKGADSGGDAGADIGLRSVFKFVSYWNPSIQTDDQGKAHISFSVPDNLTGWRVFALAMTPTDRMGLGDKGFKVNLPTEVRPVMPNQVTEGDRFHARFTVMNRTDRPRDITVNITARGALDSQSETPSITRLINVEPYKRITVDLPVQTRGAGNVIFKVTAGDDFDTDSMQHTVPVHKRRSLETAANYGTTVADKIEEQIAFPADIHPDAGGITVVTAPSVIGNLVGAFEYMRNYPYICWEQVLSKGVMASHYQKLKPYLPSSFVWKDSDRLPEQTLEAAANYQAPNGGMCYFIPRDDYADPYLSAYTALAFNWLRTRYHVIPDQVEHRLHDYLNALLKRDVYPEFYSRGMASTVRAVALAALSKHGHVNKSDIERYFTHLQFMSLFGKAHFLSAALNVEGTETMVREAADRILAHASQTGGKFMFNEELDDSFSRILATPVRANAAILNAFLVMEQNATYAELVGDVPFKLVRSLTQTRGNREHWENTQENMFCMNALIEYAAVYEKQTPDMTVTVKEKAETLGTKQFKHISDKAVSFNRPMTPADPGQKSVVTIERNGQGRLYYATRISFAPTEEHLTRINAGIDIRREYSVERNGSWVLLKSPLEIQRGELIRSDIYLSLPTARHFVVVDDPVPGGLEPVNRDLATASIVDADKGDFTASGGSWWFQFTDWISYSVSRWSFYHRELRHDAARFYSDYLPAGNYHLSYTAQAIAPGNFAQMPVHAEEMYDPDVFGKGVPGILNVTK